MLSKINTVEMNGIGSKRNVVMMKPARIIIIIISVLEISHVNLILFYKQISIFVHRIAVDRTDV